MNHASALNMISHAHPRAGFGQANLIPPEIVQGVKELITLQSDQAKADIIAEVDKKGEEAKTRALLGGFIAGAVGAAVGIGIGVAVARRR